MVLQGEVDQGREVVNVKFPHQVLAMGLDRVRTDKQVFGNRGVVVSLRQ